MRIAARAVDIPRPASSSPDGGRRVAALFAELAAARPHSDRWRAIRDELVERNLALAYYLVRRFVSRADSGEDLRQVAIIGLIKAIDRFDASRGVEFSSYATPTVLGELKRHLRDRGWAAHVPRRMQENALTVSSATTELFGTLMRAPTIAELAAHTGLSTEDVLEALDSQRGFSALSLDTESDTGFTHPVARAAEVALERAENRAWLATLLRRLTPRERHIVVLRFYANMTQSEIALAVGISQMHVSRLLSRALTKLRSAGESKDSHSLAR